MRLVELYEQYRDQVEFMVVYVREAHPTDKWWLAESRTLQSFFALSGSLPANRHVGVSPLLGALPET